MFEKYELSPKLLPNNENNDTSFHDYDDFAYCQPHSVSAANTFTIVIYLLAIGPCADPALNYLVYIFRIGCTICFLL